MRRIFCVFLVAAMVLFSAGIALADDTNVDVKNNNNNSAIAGGGNANQQQGQNQGQQQGQNQAAISSSNATGGAGGQGGAGGTGIGTGGKAVLTDSGNSASKSKSASNASNGNQSTLMNNSTPRNHVSATSGSSFVGTPILLPTGKGIKPFVCNPHFKFFSVERVTNMLDSGRFMDRKGSLWDAIFAQPAKSVVHVSFNGTPDNKPIRRLDILPKNGQLLGEFYFQGWYGWPMGAPLARTLDEAKQRTNTHNVFVWVEEEIDGKASSNTVGTGAIFSKATEDTASSFSGSANAGSTYASFEKRYSVTLWAFSDEAEDNEEICYEEIATPPPIIIAPPPLPPALAPPKVEPPKPPVCNPEVIREQIRGVEKAIVGCKYWSRENLDHRAVAAYLYEKLYICTGKIDKGLLLKSIEHANYAQKNYDEVHNPTNSLIVSRENWDETHAISVLKIVYWNQAAAIREAYGRDKEIEYAQKKGLERMPTSIEEINEIR